MKTRDLFAGCFVTISLDRGEWLVTLRKNNHETITLKTFIGLSVAMDSLRNWALLLSDESDVGVDENALKNWAELARESLALLAIGDEPPPVGEPEEALLRSDLRSWFEQEMRGE